MRLEVVVEIVAETVAGLVVEVVAALTDLAQLGRDLDLLAGQQLLRQQAHRLRLLPAQIITGNESVPKIIINDAIKL